MHTPRSGGDLIPIQPKLAEFVVHPTRMYRESLSTLGCGGDLCRCVFGQIFDNIACD